jgi:mannosyltransferase OCH1-like enzyme
MEFPKIIHFIWINFKNELEKNPQIPEQYLENIENTKRILHDYKIIIWDGYECEELIKKTFPEKIELYHSFEHPIQRCDFIRFVILYVYGGIYLDVDRYVLRSFNSLLKKYNTYDTLLDIANYGFINNDIFICKKKSQFMKYNIENCINNKNNYNYFFNIMNSCGPLYVTKNYYKHFFSKKKDYKIIGLKNELSGCTFCGCSQNKLKVCTTFTTMDNTWLDGNKFFLYDLCKYLICFLLQNIYLFITVIFIYLFYIIFIQKKRNFFKKNKK